MEGTDYFNHIQKKPVDVSCNLHEEKRTTKNLPEEIREKIFSYLSLRDLAKVELICREWKINQKFFGKFVYKIFEKTRDLSIDRVLSIVKKIDSDSGKGQQALFQLAKICAQKNASATAQSIKNFNIRDQQALLEVLKICDDRIVITNYIQNFDIQEQQVLIEIAKRYAGYPPLIKYSLGETIESFCIEDQQALVEIAKIYAQKDGENTSKYIKNFGIRDREALIEIATICVRNCPWGISEYIQNFEIKDQKVLNKIAKICAQNAADKTAKNIENFAIEDQEALIEIATICIRNDVQGTIKNIKNFGINDQDALIEMAKICAQKNALSIAHFIKNFCIKDQQALIEIAKMCLQKNAIKTAKYIDNFTTDLEILTEIVRTYVKDFVSKNKWELCLKQFLEYLRVKRDYDVQKKILIWTLKILTKLKKSSQEKISFLNPILINLADYRSPYFRKLLSKIVIDFNYTDQKEKTYQEILVNDNKSNSNHQKALMTFLLSSLISSQDNPLIENQSICKDLVHFFYSFDDSHKGDHQRIVVELLYYLHQNRKLNLDEKMRLLHLLRENLRPLDSNSTQKQKKELEQIQFFNVMTSTQVLTDLLQLGHGQKLRGITTYQEIHHQMEDLYETELGIKMENFTEHYSNTIKKWRNKQAIWTYYATQKSYERNAQLFKMFVQSVLEGSFKTLRYQNDPHLVIIFQTYPDLQEAWKIGEKVQVREFPCVPSLDRPILTVKEIFKELKGYVQEKHLGELNEVKANYPYLFEYLFGKEGNKSNYYLKIIRQKLTESQKNKEQKKIKNLTFQLQFLQLELIQFKDGEPKLKALLQNYESEKNMQFKQDIQDCLDRLKSQKIDFSTIQDWTVEDTDDPCDLLLLGTEVRNSCQRVNGDPDLNQGLLGYLLNGKNRAIVVKDHEGKILGRRLLRLLWDQKEKKAVLFQEPYYSAVEDKEVKALVDAMCKRRACSLGLPLLVGEGKESYPSAVIYPFQISSLGGQSPIEYVDALRGVQNSVFEIENCKRIA